MDIIAAILLIVGWILIGQKKILGMYLNMLAGILFFIYGIFIIGSIGVGISNLFVSIAIIFSIRKWRKDGK